MAHNSRFHSISVDSFSLKWDQSYFFANYVQPIMGRVSVHFHDVTDPQTPTRKSAFADRQSAEPELQICFP